MGSKSGDTTEIIKTSLNELNSNEKRLIQELDSNKTFYLYKGEENEIPLQFHSCANGECKNFTLTIADTNRSFGLNENNLYIFYPNETKKFNISEVNENNFILTNLKQQCENPISTDKENVSDLANGDLPLCQDW